MSEVLIPLTLIDPNPFQPRMQEDPETVGSVAASILDMGMLQTPSARRVDGGRYQLAFGHTRKAAYELLAEQDAGRFGSMPLNLVELNDLQMFEAAVSENIQRRDLNPVEVAQAMKRYMERFGKTSDACGTFFGVNGATVRGKVRLLDLPDAAKRQLATGELSEGTGRTLLALAKLADEKAIEGVLKEIKAAGNEAAPDEIVENAIDNLDSVREMWPSYREGKPRAGTNLWLLDMKNFPNKMLAALTPDKVQDALQLPADDKALEHIFDVFGKYDEEHKDDPLYANLIFDGTGISEDHIGKIKHLLNPPACTACPYYVVVNKSHYCGKKACWERKAAAFTAQKRADAMRTLKIAFHQESDGAYMILDDGIAAHRKYFEIRHPDLRLVPLEKCKGSPWQTFKGLERETGVLVVVGESINTLAVKGSKSVGKKTEKEKAEMRALRLFRQVRRELVWEYTAAAKTIFEGVPMDVLQRVRNWHFVGIDDRIPEEYNHPRTGTAAEQLEFAQRDLVWALIIGETNHTSRNDLTDYLVAFAGITGVKAPKALVKKAQEWDAEIHELAKPVSAETRKGK